MLFILRGEPTAKQIDGMADRIIATAKLGFLDKGYVDASLRTIAAAFNFVDTPAQVGTTVLKF